MDGNLIQPCRVQDEGPMDCKLLLCGSNKVFVKADESTIRISTG